MADVSIIYDLCESVLEESKKDIDSLIDKVCKSVLEKIKSLNIQSIVIDNNGKCARNTKDKIIIEQWVTTLLKEYLDMSFLLNFSKKESEENIKRMREK